MLVNKIFIWVILLYRSMISPFLGENCRFYPSCSQYALQALDRHSWFIACWLIVKRLFKCHPCHPGGVDEVPDTFRGSYAGSTN